MLILTFVSGEDFELCLKSNVLECKIDRLQCCEQIKHTNMKPKITIFLLLFFVFQQGENYAKTSTYVMNRAETADVLYKYNLLDINTYSANSGFSSATPIQLLWDGGTSTGVNDTDATGDVEAWVEFDFAKDEEISEARLWQDNGGNRVTHWKVMSWTGSGWTDIFPYTESNTVGWQSYTFDVKATKVRFYAKCATNGCVSIHELELYTKPSTEQKKTLIGCIGDSNTYGAGASISTVYSWPVQLSRILGFDYKVNNLGVSGTTLQSAPADKPWLVTSQYTRHKDLNTNISIIALGTNDSKSYNWPATAPVHFKNNYVDLIKEIEGYSSNPEVYMLMPIKAFSGNYNINNTVIDTEIRPIIREISKIYGIALIDGYTATESIGNLLPDGIHLNDDGLGILAKKVASILQTKKPIISINGSASTTAYAEYRWYRDGILIPDATASTYTSKQSGIFKVAVKLTSSFDDLIVSPNIEVSEANVNLVVSDDFTKNIVIPDNNVRVTFATNYLLIENLTGSKFYLLDICGKPVKSMIIQSSYDRIDFSDLSKGLYVYIVGGLRGKILR